MTNQINPGQLWGEHHLLQYDHNFEYLLFAVSMQIDYNGVERILHLCFDFATGNIQYDTMNYHTFINGASKLL